VIETPQVAVAPEAAPAVEELAAREPRRNARGPRKPAAKKEDAPVVLEAVIDVPEVAAPAAAAEGEDAPAKPARKPAARGSRPARKKAAE